MSRHFVLFNFGWHSTVHVANMLQNAVSYMSEFSSLFYRAACNADAV